MKHELQIHTKAVYAQMSDFYEVCSLIVALLIPLEPQTSDTQLSLLSYRLTFEVCALQFQPEQSQSLSWI